MATTRRFIIVADSIVAEANALLQDLADVDFRGGGNETFSTFQLQRLTAPATRIDAWACDWRLEDGQWLALKAALPPDGPTVGNVTWRRNSTLLDTVISWYDQNEWTKAMVLLDVSKKPFPLRLVPEV